MSERPLTVIPQPTLKRLVVYHQWLKQLQERGRDVVSCTVLARDFKLDATQIRKDLEIAGIAGTPRVGYRIDAVIASIEILLGWTNVNDAFLAGVGNLGAALLGYERFTRQGVNIIAAFDLDPAKIGTKIHGKPVFSLTKMAPLAQRMKIKIGILTVPAPAAQTVADLMIAGGIEAIWNFAPTALQVPEPIVVESVSLASSFAVLLNQLQHQRHKTTRKD
jgi:redox-sensing transcriptional repressor